ncbi:MAG: DUF4412 domain-containing protein [Elusimicrobia bacterium]|nr:DUF4412 domain-containing protein [Elusimicrobiota bacterium]
MRRWFTSLAMLTALCSVSFAASSFEGTVDYQLTDSTGKNVAIQYEVKSPKLRMTMQSERGPASILFDTPNNTMYTLVPANKLASKMTLPKPGERKAAAEKGKKVVFKDTGRKETIAGKECRVYEFSGEDTTGDVCNADGMGTFLFQSRNQPTNEWADEVRKKGGFPLRVTTKDLKGGKTMNMVATKIEAKSLPASDFEVPSDYKIVEGWGAAPAQAGAGSAAGAPPSQSDFMKRMMNASPAERAKIAEEMRKQYGGGQAPK